MVGVWGYAICVLTQYVLERCIWGSSVIQQHVAWSMMLFGTISEGPIYVVTKLDKEIMEKMLIFRQIQSLA